MTTITANHAHALMAVLADTPDIQLSVTDVPPGSDEEVYSYVIQRIWDVLLAMEEKVRGDH